MGKLVSMILLSALLAAQHVLACDDTALANDHRPPENVVDKTRVSHHLLSTVLLHALNNVNKQLPTYSNTNRIDINFENQSVSIWASRTNGFVVNNAGGLLLLWAVSNKNINGIKFLLKNAQNLTDVNVVDKQGRNALDIAQLYLELLPEDDAFHAEWQKIVQKLETIFGDSNHVNNFSLLVDGYAHYDSIINYAELHRLKAR